MKELRFGRTVDFTVAYMWLRWYKHCQCALNFLPTDILINFRTLSTRQRIHSLHEAAMRRSRSPVGECWRSVHSPSGTLGLSSDNSRFQHGLYRQHSRQCSFTSTPSEPPRNRRRCAMGGRVLRVVFGSFDSRRWLPRRLVWSPFDVLGWCRDFCDCFYRLWSCLEHSGVSHCAEYPRCGSCLSRAWQSVDHQCMF